MTRLTKILKWFLITIIGIFFVFNILFFRPDYSLKRLEKTYFTEVSHYIELSILSLELEEKNIKIHYQDYGAVNDPTIILLHGAFASSHTFEPWAEVLVAHNFRVILIDLPYHGLSGGFDDHITSLRRSSEVVLALAQELNIHSFYIGGNSMGGGVSWYTAGNSHIEGIEILGVILIDAVFPNDIERPSQSVSTLLSRPFPSWYVSRMTPKFVIKYLLNGVYGSEVEVPESHVNRYYDLLLRKGNRQAILRNTRENLTLQDQLERLEFIKSQGIPVLLMWGEEDSWIPVEVSQSFIEILDLDESSVIIFNGLGHVPMEEDPERTVLPLLDFLNK